jgi:hypothetical protein
MSNPTCGWCGPAASVVPLRPPVPAGRIAERSGDGDVARLVIVDVDRATGRVGDAGANGDRRRPPANEDVVPGNAADRAAGRGEAAGDAGEADAGGPAARRAGGVERDAERAAGAHGEDWAGAIGDDIAHGQRADCAADDIAGGRVANRKAERRVWKNMTGLAGKSKNESQATDNRRRPSAASLRGYVPVEAT